MPAIELTNLTKSYGSRRGIDRVDLIVPRGSLFGFLGPNGAGKSTAIRALVGLLRPDGGTAKIFGHDCWRDGPRARQGIGYLPGDLRLYRWMTGENALRLFGRMRKCDMLIRGQELAEYLGLDLDVRAHRMSRGMKQKLGLLLALAHDPQLVILDEPTTGLDPLVQDKLHVLLRELSQRGRTVFFSSHTLDEVERLCERVAIIRDGRIVTEQSLTELQRDAGYQVAFSMNGASETPATLPAQLTVTDQTRRTLTGIWSGSATELLDWLGQLGVVDVTIQRPELQTLFARYYTDGGDS